MPNGGIPQEEFEKELDRVQLSRRHADIAFAWMRANGQQGVYDIWHYNNAPIKNSAWAALYDGNKYFLRQAAKYTYLFALNEKDGLDDEPPFEETNKRHRWDGHNFGRVLEKLGIPTKRFPESTNSETNTPRKEDSMTKTAIELLRQFYQIIFHGPPGTGKTHCAKQLLPELLESPDSTPQQLQSEGRWDIVQFHPSYNYEDFVRGVQVKTKGEQVVYETLNRTFGDMCRTANAEENRDKKFALIIDEINRANVSAVLGELIYALEYRGQPINTPYDAGDGKALTIPKNLYVIGTMNTADRTIGQIDYAVRRRFAFIACPPNEQIIHEQKALGKADDNSLKFFRRVDALFVKNDENDFISSDFDAADVRVGHSYFLAAGSKLGYKLVYQVIPILREYVKDGVLKESATAEIDKIEVAARELLEGKSLAGELAESDSSADEKSGGTLFYRWRTSTREGFDKTSRVWLAFARDYVKENNPQTLDVLKAALFPSDALHKERESAIRKEADTKPNSCYMQNPIFLADGTQVFASKHTWNNAEQFVDVVGYQINPCYIVNLGEGNQPGGKSRRWELCREHNFISAGGSNYVAPIKSLAKGDIVFVNLVATDDGEGGVVACGEVEAEAEPIEKFRTTEGLLADIVVEGGQTYRERYAPAFDGGELREHVVRVRWINDKPREEGKRFPSAPRGFKTDKIKTNDFRKLRDHCNLPPKEGD